MWKAIYGRIFLSNSYLSLWDFHFYRSDHQNILYRSSLSSFPAVKRFYLQLRIHPLQENELISNGMPLHYFLRAEADRDSSNGAPWEYASQTSAQALSPWRADGLHHKFLLRICHKVYRRQIRKNDLWCSLSAPSRVQCLRWSLWSIFLRVHHWWSLYQPQPEENGAVGCHY